MNVSRISDVARYWAGLALLERLGRSAAGLTSEEVCSILGARNVKGIGAALSCTRLLGARNVKGIGAALSCTRLSLRVGDAPRRGAPTPPGARAKPLERGAVDHPGAPRARAREADVDVARTQRSYAIDGGIAGLDARLDDEWFEAEAGGQGRSGRSSATESNRDATGGRARCPRATARTGSGCASATNTPLRGPSTRLNPSLNNDARTHLGEKP